MCGVSVCRVGVRLWESGGGGAAFARLKEGREG